MNLTKIVVSLIIAFGSQITRADDNFMQNYYDNGAIIMGEVKKCTSRIDQFSNATTTCYINASKKIQDATNAFYQKHQSTFSGDYAINGYDNLLLNGHKLDDLKKSCESLYPVALRSYFKNQILECKTQLDLQRYFFFPRYILNN